MVVGHPSGGHCRCRCRLGGGGDCIIDAGGEYISAIGTDF